MKICWEHLNCQGVLVRNTLDGVASWCDETSEHDDFTLRVMYSQGGRKLAAAFVEEDGTVIGWSVLDPSTI